MSDLSYANFGVSTYAGSACCNLQQIQLFEFEHFLNISQVSGIYGRIHFFLDFF